MAIFDRIPQADIKAGFTHVALAFGWVPIYYNEHTYDFAVRNWLPDWLADLGMDVWEVGCMMRFALDPEWESAGLPIMLIRRV